MRLLKYSYFYLKRWITDLEVDSRLSELLVFSALLGLTLALEMIGGESFSPDDACDSAWNSVKLMKGKYTINYFQYQAFGALRCRVVVTVSLLMVLTILLGTP